MVESPRRSSLTRLRLLLCCSGQRIPALAFGGAPLAAREPASPSLDLCAGLRAGARTGVAGNALRPAMGHSAEAPADQRSRALTACRSATVMVPAACFRRREFSR